MSLERELPLNYQITVTNVMTIGSKSMADFFVSFSTPSGRQWKSPVIHGRVTKENTRYPWIFTVDNHQLTINFHEIDHKNGKELLVGSMPLLLMKREGEEEFLIFGCTESNRGRKVAEVEFTYVQCSGLKSLSSYKKSDVSNQQSKRVSLQYTIEVENQDAKKGLNIIPEEPEVRESLLNSKLPIDSNESLLQQDFHPSKLEILKVETNRNKALSEDSNFQLNLIKEMQDPADKWYRNNFGREKPSNLQNYEFDIQNSRMVSIVYEKSYEYLNELSFPDPHMEIKNIIIHSEKKPKVIQLFSIDMDGSQLIKDKIASMQAQGTKYEWSNAVRLPKEKKAYGIEITTSDNEKLQGLILKDANHTKSSLEIYNKKGFKVGKVNYSLKEIKKIQIQTLQIMEMQPVPEEESNELDKSFLKSVVPKTETKLESLLHNDTHSRTDEGKNKLIKEIYLNRERQSEELPRQLSLPLPNQRLYEHARAQPEIRRQITNQAYLGRDVAHSPLKKSNPRKNQYVPIAQPPSAQSSQSRSATKAVSPFLQESLIKQSTPSQTPQSNNSQEISQQANQFLPSQNSYENEELTEARITEQEPEGNKLTKKIEELKRIGTDLGKKAKAFPSKKFTKNAKYKTVIYQQEQGIDYEQKRSLDNSDSGKQEQNHKKAYREPINATPSFQSLLINNTFSKEQDSKASKIATKTKPVDHSHAQETNRAETTQQNISEANQISDESQEVPITRHKTADQNLLKEMIQQKETDINSKRQESMRAQSIIPEESQREKKGNSFGVNTQRMSINNVMQTSFVPTTPTQKRASPVLDELKSIDYEPSEGWQHKRSLKEEVVSVRDSVIDHSHHTKYSSQTIQPATQIPAGQLNYQITSISVNYYQSAFGNKYLKIYIPNKHYYETPLNSNSNTLLWKCNGFLFSNVHQSQDLYIQLYNSIGEEQKMLGRVILNSREFHPQAQQAVVRAYLVLQSKIIGEIVIGYHSFGKNKKRNTNWQAERDLSNHREAVSESHFNQSKKETTPIKRKRKKRDKSLNDSLTKFLRKNRKEKINRYIVNEYSRAHIESRINPIQPRKYTGKNITIGRDIRFPFGPEDEHKILTPGPGAYRQKSDFQRYHLRHQKQK